MSESLLAVTDRDDSLRVAVPRNVVDAPGDDVIVAWTWSASLSSPAVCGGPFQLAQVHIRTFCRAVACAVPDLYSSRHISTCHIVSGGRETGDGGLSRVLRVLFTDGGVVDRAQEDGFARLMHANQLQKASLFDSAYSQRMLSALPWDQTREALADHG